MLSAAPRQAISSSASSSKVTDPALAAILQRRRLLSEPQEATAPAPAVESPAVAVRPGIVQEALAAIEERRAEPPPKAVQCFDMATDSESEDAEDAEQCRLASSRGWWRAVEVTPSHRARRPRATRTSRPPRWKSGADLAQLGCESHGAEANLLLAGAAHGRHRPMGLPHSKHL